MVSLRSIAKRTGRAMRDFSMIKNDDRVLIGYSGGKDSYCLIKILLYLREKYGIDCELKAICVDPGFDDSFSDKIMKSLAGIDIPFEIISSKISNIVSERKDKDLCYNCARFRRGILYKYAKDNDFNKIALGHNLDDAIETYLLNMFFSHQISPLRATYVSSEHGIGIIRPLIYVDSDLIVEYVKSLEFEVVKNNCPLRIEDSKRLFFRRFLSDLKRENSGIKESALNALFRNSN